MKPIDEEERTKNLEIIIQSPALNSSGGVGEHPISGQCEISASGTLGYYNTKTLRSIQGQLNGGPIVAGTHDGRNWSISGLRPAHVGSGNTVRIEGTYTDYSTATPAERSFIGVGGYGCYQTDARAILPRYFAVSLETPRQEPGTFQNLMMGGLVTKNHVYLEYLPEQSMPEIGVWRDINLPHAAGHWILRLFFNRPTASAQIAYQRIDESTVHPPMIWSTADWSMNGPNLMVPDAPFAGSKMATNLWIEPA